MRLESVRKIAARAMGVGEKKVWFDQARLSKIEEAITTQDIKALIKEGAIKKRKGNMQSRARARKLQEKRKKGRKRGKGKRTGTKKARMGKKQKWVERVRPLRKKLRELKKQGLLKEKGEYKKYYKLVKGNFFRGKKQLESAVKGEK